MKAILLKASQIVLGSKFPAYETSLTWIRAPRQYGDDAFSYHTCKKTIGWRGSSRFRRLAAAVREKRSDVKLDVVEDNSVSNESPGGRHRTTSYGLFQYCPFDILIVLSRINRMIDDYMKRR